MDSGPEQPSFREALRFWGWLGCVSFGGPSGQIAIMHRELVERRKWVGEARFLHALDYCMLLPGPEAQQLAIYSGWTLHGMWGGIAAGVLFVLPAAFLLWALSWIYAVHGQVAWVAALFAGLQPAVVALVAWAVVRIGKKALASPAHWGIALLSFALLLAGWAPFPAIVAGAALLGLAGPSFAPQWFQARTGHGGDDLPIGPPPSWRRALGVIGVCGALWAAPVVALAAWQGSDSILVDEARFFSQAAMVTFGGAYAVLPYVSDAAVNHYGWVDHGQMMAGLGLAESTPGPLILVLEFYGFLGAWREPGSLAPWLAGALGAFITVWVTFVPCFLWIFLGAPHVERLRGKKRLSTALSAITAAVVGVVAVMALQLGRAALFPIDVGDVGGAGSGSGAADARFLLGGFDAIAALIALIALLGLARWKWPTGWLVLGCAILGALRFALGG